jgi:hypothetical protein
VWGEKSSSFTLPDVRRATFVEYLTTYAHNFERDRTARPTSALVHCRNWLSRQPKRGVVLMLCGNPRRIGCARNVLPG